MNVSKMVDCYLSDIPVFVSGYGFDMLYAGPREALLHAIIRQNMGQHISLLGDHAGVGDFMVLSKLKIFLINYLMLRNSNKDF